MDPLNAKNSAPQIEQADSDNDMMWDKMRQESNIGRKRIIKGTGTRSPRKRGMKRK